MTQVTIQLEPAIAHWLEHRARENSREAEIKAILEATAQTKESDKAIKTAAAWERINKARAKYGDRVFSDSVELLRENRNHVL
jgi:hypothetical protein